MKWLCRCDCGTEREVLSKNLRDGRSTACGECEFSKTKRIDLTGKTFGEWHVDSYAGDKYWNCTCSCGRQRKVPGFALRTRGIQQCGHTNRLIDSTCQHLEKTDSIDLEVYDELYDELKSLIDEDSIKIHDKTVLKNLNQELDFYIPEKNLAVEVDGTYWHSQKLKDPKYHQNKSLECLNAGVRLIHIFEYEWIQDETREKIKQLLRNALSSNIKTVYARKCYIKEIDTDIEKEFLNSYHLQGYASSSIKYGLYSQQDDELLSIMTFGASRFNNQYQYELIRYCNKPEIRVIGGAEKLFKRFIKDHNPEQIISYCSLSKFSGGVYSRLGFNRADRFITEPNYVWVPCNFSNDKTVLTRYQTQIKKLKDQGLEIYGHTEDEIMQNRGYFKIYDSGNMRFVWARN